MKATSGQSHDEVFLQPGDYYFTQTPTRIRTLLGSCIAITLWHPLLLRGGMVHCLLPSRGAPAGAVELSGRFVDEGIRWLLREAVRAYIDPAQCQFKLFGGSDMFAALGITARRSIGEANAAMGVKILERLGLHVCARDFGGTVHRSLVFDVSTGDVWVRYGERHETELDREYVCA